jgi:hypothetical protein
MVFLGGAVLANIVSLPLKNPFRIEESKKLTDVFRWPTRKACGYPSKSGKNKVLVLWTSWVHDDKIMHASILQINEILSNLQKIQSLCISSHSVFSCRSLRMLLCVAYVKY